MRIGIVVDNEFDHDVRVRSQHKLLKESFNEVFVLCFDHGTEGLMKEDSIFRVKMSRKRKNMLYGVQNTYDGYGMLWKRAIRMFVSQLQLDVVHVHDLYMGLPAKLALKGLDCKLILDLHENYPETVASQTWAIKGWKKFLAKPGKWKQKEKKYLLGADKIVVLSDHFKGELTERYPIEDERFVVFPNVPTLEQYDQVEHSMPDGPLTLAYYGGIGVRRGVFEVMEALINDPRLTEVRLKLIGPVDGNDRTRFDHLLAQLGKRCEHVLWIDNRELGNAIRDAHVCLSPIYKNKQHESGVANKVFQYMMFGKPLIVSNCAPQQKVVEDAQCGWVFEDRNEESLIAVIHNVAQLSNVDLSAVGKRGHKAVMDHYNMNFYGSRLTEAYLELASKPS